MSNDINISSVGTLDFSESYGHKQFYTNNPLCVTVNGKTYYRKDYETDEQWREASSLSNNKISKRKVNELVKK